MILKILIVLKHFEKLKFTITITINLILENIFWPAGVKIESFGSEWKWRKYNFATLILTHNLKNGFLQPTKNSTFFYLFSPEMTGYNFKSRFWLFWQYSKVSLVERVLKNFERTVTRKVLHCTLKKCHGTIHTLYVTSVSDNGVFLGNSKVLFVGQYF